MRYTLEELHSKFEYNSVTGDIHILKHGKSGKRKLASTINPDGYYRFNWKLHGKIVPVLLHRVAWELYHNKLLGNLIIDHKDQNRLNNKIKNIRAVTRAVNNRNLPLKVGNKFGCHGIEQLPSGNYYVRITNKGVRIRLGSYKKLEDAISARKAAEVKYGFYKNHGNIK